MIVNYGRHRQTRAYIFLHKGELCPGHVHENDWVWYQPPLGHPRAQYFLLIGESSRNHLDRLIRLRSEQQ